MSKSSRAYVCLLLTIAIFSSLSYAASPDRIAGTINSNQIVELTGHVSVQARPQYDQGPVDPSRSMTVTMLLLPSAQQQATLTTLLAQQQDRKSPQYHKWLTVAQYADQFGMSQADIAKISSWLQSQGLKVTYVANGRDFVSFQGTAEQMQNAFRTQIHTFNVNGKMHFANVMSPSIPAALSGIVGGFRGLHDFFPHSMLRKRPSFSVDAGGGEFYTYLAPGDLATIYDINNASAATNGSGEKVVIAGQSDIYIADINNFRGAFGFTTLTGCTTDSATHTILQAGTCATGNFQQVWPNGNDPGLSAGDLGESDLDIETMSGVAPGATIVFVTSGNGVDDSVSYAVDQNPPLAKVISYSYGLCEALVSGEGAIASAEAVYQKADSLGISMFAASGDSGAAICDGDIGGDPATYGPSVSYPASSAYVTGVGGSEFNEGSGNYWNPPADNTGTGGSALSYIPEIAWNDTFVSGVDQLDGTGGGPSNCAFGSGTHTVTYKVGSTTYDAPFEICDASPNGGFAKPTWQSGGITPSDGVRDVPDISFSASNVNDPYIVCVPESEAGQGSSSTSTCASGITTALNTYNSAFGGTSASTPLTAGMFVLLNQYLASDGQGLVNPQLYSLLTSNPAVFHAIAAGSSSTITGAQSSNAVPCTDGTPSFEASALQCTGGTFGSSVAGGKVYNAVTGLGSVDINAFITAWAGAVTDFTVAAGAVSPTSVAAGGSAATTVTIAPVSGSGFTGNVMLSCPNTPTGISCPTFSPSATINDGSGTATATIQVLPNVAAGSYSITIKGTSGSSSTSTTVNLTVTATTQSFTLTPENQTYNVTPGQMATVTVAVASTNGFVTGSGSTQATTVPLTWTCSDPASESTCTIATPTTTATSVSFSISTTAPIGQLRRPLDRSPRIFYAALLPGLLGIVLTFGSRKKSSRCVKMLGLIVVLGFSMMGLNSCGGSNNSSSNNPGTPANSYTITFNATTGGAAPLTSSTTVTLAVQ